MHVMHTTWAEHNAPDENCSLQELVFSKIFPCIGRLTPWVDMIHCLSEFFLLKFSHFQVISKVSDLFSSRSVVETMRSISEGEGVNADPETLARLTNSVYKAYMFYQDAAAAQGNQKQEQEDLTAQEW